MKMRFEDFDLKELGVNGKQAALTSRTKVLCNGERIYVLSRNENTHTQMIIWIM